MLLQGALGAPILAGLRRGENNGGERRDRTADILLAKQTLSRLSYFPNSGATGMVSNLRPSLYRSAALPTELRRLSRQVVRVMVRAVGFEPTISRIPSAAGWPLPHAR